MSKIMVVEEDNAMRMLFCEWLEGEGHLVRTLPRLGMPGGEAADDSVALVLLDLPHPRTRAAAAAMRVQQARDVYRQASIVGISAQVGRSLGGGSSVTRGLNVENLLAKPCTRQDLLDAVAAAL